MDKPWDVLRVAETKLPMQPGSWQSGDGKEWVHTPVIEWLGYENTNRVSLRFGRNPGTVGFTVEGLRQLAEFATELADQLENK